MENEYCPICPIMSEGPMKWVDCQKEECAWWYKKEECCALPVIAGGMIP